MEGKVFKNKREFLEDVLGYSISHWTDEHVDEEIYNQLETDYEN